MIESGIINNKSNTKFFADSIDFNLVKNPVTGEAVVVDGDYEPKHISKINFDKKEEYIKKDEEQFDLA